MYHEKRYVQYNDLVFDGYDMIRTSDESTGFKVNTTEYSYGHGSYAPLKDEYLYVSEGSVSMTLSLHTGKVPCDEREFYVRFAEQELAKAGRLWAIKNNEVIWAYAITKNIHMVKSYRQNFVEYDVEFTLPEGIWHKADKQRTFVVPYNVCSVMDCKGYRNLNPCSGGDCCTLCEDRAYQASLDERCFCCCYDDLSEDMALCYHMKDLQKFYGCDVPYQFVYDCVHAEKFNKNDFLGQRMCVKDICDSSMVTGRFYSETDIPTRDVRIVIKGEMHNPWITINGNTNIVQGDYSGALILEPSGDIYYQANECCEPVLVSPLMDDGVTSRLIIPSGMDYGWLIQPQWNTLRLDLNRCCNGATCAYIDIDNITI